MMIKKIALTGGIGSGKSTVLKLISNAGYNTISLDEVYSELLEDENFVVAVSELMDTPPVKQNGNLQIDRKSISEKVFSNKELNNKLTSFTHSRIFERAFSKCVDGLNFIEVPLLFEYSYAHMFDRVIVVLRDKAARIKSAMQRDGCDEHAVEQKMDNQFDYDNSDLSLHIIINNDCDIKTLESRVVKAIGEIG